MEIKNEDETTLVITNESETEEEVEIETKHVFVPQRLEGESFEDYKHRRFVANYKLHQMAKGKLFWDSRPDPDKKGVTYRKEK